MVQISVVGLATIDFRVITTLYQQQIKLQFYSPFILNNITCEFDVFHPQLKTPKNALSLQVFMQSNLVSYYYYLANFKLHPTQRLDMISDMSERFFKQTLLFLCARNFNKHIFHRYSIMVIC